jgi:aromatic ring-cleaving dioxygenase
MAAAGCQKQPVRWLTVEDIRKQQRMRRQVVVKAMLSGELPYEQRGRIRYTRVSEVEAWELPWLTRENRCKAILIHPALVEFTK